MRQLPSLMVRPRIVASILKKQSFVWEVLFVFLKLNLAGNFPGGNKEMRLREQSGQSQASELAYSLSDGPRSHASELKGRQVNLRQTTGPLGNGPDTKREASGPWKEAQSCNNELAAPRRVLCWLRSAGGRHKPWGQSPLNRPSRTENGSGGKGDFVV